MEEHVLAAAKRAEKAAAMWLSRAATECEKLAELDMQEVEDYQYVIAHFQQRLTAWESAHTKLEQVLPEEDFENVLDAAIDYWERMVEAKNTLVNAWVRGRVRSVVSPADQRGDKSSGNSEAMENPQQQSKDEDKNTTWAVNPRQQSENRTVVSSQEKHGEESDAEVSLPEQ